MDSKSVKQETGSKLLIYISTFLVIYVILAFGAVASVQSFRLERYTKPFVVIHIIASMGWLFLFVYQTILIKKQKVGIHKKMLNLAYVLVLISVVSSIYYLCLG